MTEPKLTHWAIRYRGVVRADTVRKTKRESIYAFTGPYAYIGPAGSAVAVRVPAPTRSRGALRIGGGMAHVGSVVASRNRRKNTSENSKETLRRAWKTVSGPSKNRRKPL